MYQGGAITVDGVRVTEHAVSRLLEWLPVGEVSPAGCATLLAAALREGFVAEQGLPNDCALVRSALLPGGCLVAKVEGTSPVVVTVLRADQRPDPLLEALRPLLNEIDRIFSVKTHLLLLTP